MEHAGQDPTPMLMSQEAALPAMTQSQPLFVHFLIASETLTIPCVSYFSFQIFGPHAVTSAL